MRRFMPVRVLFRYLLIPILIGLLAVPPALSAQESPRSGRARANAKSEPVAATPPSAYNGHPKLAIIIVIDQFREDYLERYRADFKGHGFRLFLDKGAYFPDCYYDYANTKTAPGHSTIGTGAYSDGHGIANNDWWDLTRNKERPITSVEDERYALVGVPQGSKPAPGSSPRNLRASTVGDELRLATAGQAKVFGISLKDRASILPAGSAANAAYWIDAQSGAFISSTYYESQLPDWAAAFNASNRAAQATQDAQAFANSAPAGTAYMGAPGASTNFYNFVGRTPAANAYELDFARALIQGERLYGNPPDGDSAAGQTASPSSTISPMSTSSPVTNLITISLSANDILGHAVGPDSPAEHAMVDSLDTDLDGFFTWLDKNVEGGLGNVWIALTADHGIAPIPSEAAKLGVNAATINSKKLLGNLNEAMNAKFSPGEKVNYLFDRQELPFLSLNQPNFDRAGINEQEAEQAVLDALPSAVDSLSVPDAAPDTSNDASKTAANQSKPNMPSQTRLPPTPALIRAYSRQQLAAGNYPTSEFGQILAHSYSPNGGWYVMTIFADYQMEGSASGGTTHFSPWSYDRHVPLGFYGAPFAPGVYHGRVGPVDLAATWAALLGINQPSASVGHVLTQALKPATAVSYPKRVPVRSHSPKRERSRTLNTAAPKAAPSVPQP
ncbi:Alkaline phosphatase [Acidisarcina polymorpha]|uniref:Alkaline phosphatase n=1 Tax=Acidisarcina polymorpha TaxID=2211140 RepID=A0A2Z5FVB6_9BACT|nr:alkaline phosphatase family protein [Acidisarcina polymorpha]AXC10833.1 Alkaline phosphatase [Acidisarcina polymorpha]